MFHSVSRAAFVFVLALAFALSAIPAQAQPRDFESSAIELQDSWLDAVMSWFQSFLPGDELSVTTMGGGHLTSPPSTGDGGTVGTMSTSCIDPMGNPCIEFIP